MNKNIAIIAGARPNFMKIVPLCLEFKKQGLKYFLLNTAQHFDNNMASDFFKEFGVKPDYTLSLSHDSVMHQFSDIMLGIEKIFKKEKPTVVVVVGDVNSTLIASLVANKMGIKLVHIEAGLRSYNSKMPEETNRVLTDHMSDALFVTSEDGIKNLHKEGILENIHSVGNIMMDTLEMFLGNISESDEHFYFCTLHRAENVDDKKIFTEILNALEVISKDAKIYLPLHPRTEKMAKKFGMMKKIKRIFSLLPPISYKDSLFYQKNAKLVLTDSGGVQEESSYLGTPCITLRTETERPITVTHGTSTIGGVTTKSILKAYKNKNLEKQKVKIPLWDGKTSKRIVDIIKNNSLFK